MKIALAHDSFTQAGGAERVIEGLHELYPDAPVFTLVVDKKFKQKYKAWDIRSSRLQLFYNLLPKFQYLLPVIPWAVSSLDFKGYDVVLSSSSGFIKNIQLPKNTVHVDYCHTPTRFLWLNEDYVRQEVPAIIRPAVKLFLRWMRAWDFKGAHRVNKFIANSREVQKRIYDSYHLPSTVIYPFVDVNFWHPTAAKSNYFLLAGRLQAHKKHDLIIRIFNDLKIPLHVVGTGRQENYLTSIAKSNVGFFGKISDEALRGQYSGALAVIYPQVEDFGLVPLEAAACGTASIGIAKGGSLETIVPGVTGELFEDYDAEKIKQIILSWNPQKYSAADLRSHAEKFSKEKFKENILEFINSV